MKFGAGVLLGLVFTAPLLPQQVETPAAVELAQGASAPYSGVLIPESTYRHMAQATLDVPLLREEVAAWTRGHELALVAMESAQDALKGCAPQKGGIAKVVDSVERLAPLLLAVTLCRE